MVRGCSRAVDSVTDHAAELLCGEGNSLQVTETIKRAVCAHACFSHRILT